MNKKYIIIQIQFSRPTAERSLFIGKIVADDFENKYFDTEADAEKYLYDELRELAGEFIVMPIYPTWQWSV